MARRLRLFIPNIPCHIIQRGNNKTRIFHENNDCLFFIETLLEARLKYPCKIYSYCLMPNHFHLIINPQSIGNVSLFMKLVGGKYVRYFNKKYDRTGTLWENRFRSFIIGEESYFIRCLRYVETNPARAGLVKIPESCKWTSYHFRALGLNNPLLDLDPWFSSLGTTMAECRLMYARFIKESVEENELDQLRKITQKGGVFADAKLKEYIEKSYPGSIAIKHPGRPKHRPNICRH
jgi:putative transposase